MIGEADTKEERALILAKTREETKRLEALKASLARAEALPAPESPERILEAAERRVEGLRASLARGGDDAAGVVEALLGEGERFTARRLGAGWELTAHGMMARVFVDSSHALPTRRPGSRAPTS